MPIHINSSYFIYLFIYLSLRVYFIVFIWAILGLYQYKDVVLPVQ